MNPEAKTALAAAAAAFQTTNLRLRILDLERRVTGEVAPTACWACGAENASYGPPRRSAGYRACAECFAQERTAGSETLFRHVLTEAVLAAHGYIGPDEVPPMMTEAPVYADSIGASPRRPLADRWGYLTMTTIGDLADRAGVDR